MKILIVDDHAVVRAGVARMLATARAEILEAESSDDALKLFRQERPDLVILDLNLAGSSGLDLLRRLMALDRTANILILSMHAEPVYAARALQAGARGYVSKSAPTDEFIQAVKQVGQGSNYIEQEIAAQLALSKFSRRDPFEALSTRELDILRLLGEGNSYAQIAAAIGVSYKTVANTASSLKAKLSVDSTADLIRLSLENLRK
jgi:two-component system, NarL family, invasion response regulator UvrY